MKIDSTSKVAGGPASAGQGLAVRPATVPTPEPAGLQVDISRTASTLTQVGESFDAARVAEIRQAIAEGRFKINPDRIADGLLDSVRSMLARQPQREA